jgi:hypothetical protein
MCRLRWFVVPGQWVASASSVPICVHLIHNNVRGKTRYVDSENICCVVLAGGLRGQGGAVYLSFDADLISNTAVALTDCTMINNTAGLC